MYLKTPERVKAMGYVFLLALLVATYLEFRVRHTLARRNQTVLNRAGKPESRPTFKTIREVMEPMEILIVHTEHGLVRKIKRSTPQRLSHHI
ncbi:hypothetical protein [Heliophilum fasciatum]|uniref:Uncharacterized protein n=1 Tax=Heliophilum fasciatum TaxID=35700 RepID=A0A4R2R9J9_9FIRM|nr:hypothetical protein [Heliophilum fasciatum]MCW2279437.1 transposase [Heliophilum fasciatum]TCP59900.1 hypothetical protein EDD73_14511 [Heliophilum fasciatum]